MSLELQYAPTVWARLLARLPDAPTTLTRTTLTLPVSDGPPMQLSPEQCLGVIERRSRLIWHTIVIRADTGSIYLRGLRFRESRTWERALNLWQEDARLASLEPLRQELIALVRLCDGLWSGEHYVRASAHQALVDRARSALGALTPSRWRLWGNAADQLLEQRIQAAVATAEQRRSEANAIAVRSATTRFKELFDHIEKQPLTDAQRRACVMEDENNLVLAGAGTGKTSVVLGRIAYLLSSQRAAPNEILALAYNRDAAKELQDRVRDRVAADLAPEKVTVRTFHAFGGDVIGMVEGRKPSLSKLAEDSAARDTFVTTAFEQLLHEAPYRALFLECAFLHSEHYISPFDFDSLEAYERDRGSRELRTLSGELVKSTEELRIANWLTLHGIDFQYETRYPADTADTADPQHRAYKPDFTLARPGNTGGAVFLEHFGIDERGNPPPYFTAADAERYRLGITWKRELHRQCGTTLIETCSYEFRRGAVFLNLTDHLQKVGIAVRARSEEECLELLRGSHAVSQTGALFSELLPVCRELGREQNMDSRIEALPAEERDRCRLLWRLMEPILVRYREALGHEDAIDFGEMLQRAIRYVRDGRYHSQFRHILVDEFQDISEPRAELVTALRNQSAQATLFCVGDDWQSIYRFTGSDVRYTSEFGKRIGAGATEALDTTFRFNNQIGNVASTFVMRNPAQTRKVIHSVRTVIAPAVSLVPTADFGRTLPVVLERIAEWGKARSMRYSVRLLARYWYELEGLHRTAQRLARDLDLDVEISSVHAAKGLEADFVILVGLGEGENGFPAHKPADPFRELFLPAPEAFQFAEERRLFYVALTRARHRVYLLYDTHDCSEFVRELKEGGYAMTADEFRDESSVQREAPAVRCPRCATGLLGPRTGQFGQFISCSRYPKCNYSERGCGDCGGLLLRVGEYRVCADVSCAGVHSTCPRCGSPMQLRQGQYGAFFGCGNFGKADVDLQCTAKLPARPLPSAHALRGRP
jgi:DNA helicase IV